MPKAVKKKVAFTLRLEIYKIQRSKPPRRYQASVEERACDQLHHEAISFGASHRSKAIETKIDPLSHCLLQLMRPAGFPQVMTTDPNRYPRQPMAGSFVPPWPHTELQPDSETRDLALVRGDLTHATARTNYELRYINEKLKLSAEVWPKDSLEQQIRDFPFPSCEPLLGQLKTALQSIALDEEYPTFIRVVALSNWLNLSNNPQSYFDLVEKAKAMLHEIKFRIQGDNDWNKVRWLQRNLEERMAKIGQSKDGIPKQPGFQTHLHRLPRFVQHSFAQWQEYVGWDKDMSFANEFGIETSKATLEKLAAQPAEPAIERNGGYNGHEHGMEMELLDDEDDDSSDLEEITPEAFEIRQTQPRRRSSSQNEPIHEPSTGRRNESDGQYDSQGSYLDSQVDEADDADDADDGYDEEYDMDASGDQDSYHGTISESHQASFRRDHATEAANAIEESQSIADSDELEIVEERSHTAKDGLNLTEQEEDQFDGAEVEEYELDDVDEEEYDNPEDFAESGDGDDEDSNQESEDVEDIEGYEESAEDSAEYEESGHEDGQGSRLPYYS